VLKWAGIQTKTAEIRALDKWAKRKLSEVVEELRLLGQEPASQEEPEIKRNRRSRSNLKKRTMNRTIDSALKH
jgi:hypothetical protein